MLICCFISGPVPTGSHLCIRAKEWRLCLSVQFHLLILWICVQFVFHCILRLVYSLRPVRDQEAGICTMGYSSELAEYSNTSLGQPPRWCLMLTSLTYESLYVWVGEYNMYFFIHFFYFLEGGINTVSRLLKQACYSVTLQILQIILLLFNIHNNNCGWVKEVVTIWDDLMLR